MDDNTPPLAAPPAPNTRAALFKVGRQIRDTPALLPWMRAYAEWLMLECVEVPKTATRLARARGLARAPVSPSHLTLLEAREDFAEYCEELHKGPLEAARAKFASAFPTYVEAHRQALDMAVAAQDIGGIARLAEPVLDRIYPKKVEATQATQINIVLTPEQIRGVSGYAAPVMTVDEPTSTLVVDDAS